MYGRMALKIQKIYSKNAAFQKFEVLKTNRNKRHKYGEFIVEGVRNINEAIKNNWHIDSFIYTFDKPMSKWAADILKSMETTINYELTRDLMGELSSKEDTSELLAVIRMKNDNKEFFKLSTNPVLVLFDRPSNKGNLGTILRSCDGMNVEGLIITGHAVDIYDPDVISSSMGSFFKVPFIKLSDNKEIDDLITKLKNMYPLLKTVGTSSRTNNHLYSVNLSIPILFLIGNETDGLNRHLMEKSDIMATIPMSSSSSASSLNVSCAATVMFYEAMKQRALSVGDSGIHHT